MTVAGVGATGSTALFLVFFVETAVSVSDSEMRGVLAVFRVEGVLDLRLVRGVGSTSSCASPDLLFLPLGVLGGGGGGIVSLSVSSSTLLS